MKKLTAGLAGLTIAGISLTANGVTWAASNVRTTSGNGTNMSAGSTVNGLDSLNWAGYVDTNSGDYGVGNGQTASASWSVPSVWGPDGYAASWVGLDGLGSQTVEQTGTDSAVIYGAPIYLAWVELYPAPPVTINAAVYPGDRMSGSVKAVGGGHYAIRLTDNTRGWHYAQTVLDPSGSNASAEVITEAPESAATGNILPLANFGSEHFTAVNISGHATKMNMVARNWRVKASVTGSQKDFTVHFGFAGLQG